MSLDLGYMEMSWAGLVDYICPGETPIYPVVYIPVIPTDNIYAVPQWNIK